MPDNSGHDGVLYDGVLRDEPETPLVLTSERVYHGAVWDVRAETFDYRGKEIARQFVDHTGAVAVLVMDDDGRVLLIQQYRHAVRQREWELPAGLLDVAGEDALVAAKRELAEEADLVAADWSELVEFYSTPGGSNELIKVYQASGVSPSEETFARFDEEADILKRWVPLDDVVAGVFEGRFKNSILAIAVLAAHART
jgi:8-oxo-dGDP phosphatase